MKPDAHAPHVWFEAVVHVRPDVQFAMAVQELMTAFVPVTEALPETQAVDTYSPAAGVSQVAMTVSEPSVVMSPSSQTVVVYSPAPGIEHVATVEFVPSMLLEPATHAPVAYETPKIGAVQFVNCVFVPGDIGLPDTQTALVYTVAPGVEQALVTVFEPRDIAVPRIQAVDT